MSGSSTKMRAILLSFVMVVSMVAIGGFAGTAAAADNDGLSSVDSVTAPDIEIEQDDVTVTYDVRYTHQSNGDQEDITVDLSETVNEAASIDSVSNLRLTSGATGEVTVGSLTPSGSPTDTVTFTSTDDDDTSGNDQVTASFDVTYDTTGQATEASSTNTVKASDQSGTAKTATDTNGFEDTAVSVSTAVTQDTDSDGTVDQIELTFDQEVQDTNGDSAFEAGDFTLKTDTGTVDTISDDDADEVLLFGVTPDDTGDTTITPELDTTAGVTFADKGTQGDVNPGADGFDQATTDNADLVILGAETTAQNELSFDVSEGISTTASDHTITVNGNDLTAGTDYLDGDTTSGGPSTAATIALDDVQGIGTFAGNLRLTPTDQISVELEASVNTQTDTADVTNNLLDVSTTPTSATRGETINVEVDLNNPDGSDYTQQAQVAIVGLDNANDAPGTADSDFNSELFTIEGEGSTTSGTYTQAITLNGQDDSGNLINEYFVVVRKGGTTFTNTAPFEGAGDLQNVDGSIPLSAAPDVVVDTSDVTRQSSSTISGSVTISDGSGVSGEIVDIRNSEDTTVSVGTTTTADNGDFATTQTFDDAATYAATLQLYNSSRNSLENDEFATFEVTPDSAAVSGSNSPVAQIRDQRLGFDVTVADSGVQGSNATYVRLSGVEMSKLDLNPGNNGNEIIKQVTLTNGETFGSIPQAAENTDDFTTNDDTSSFGTADQDTAIPTSTLSNSPNIESAILKLEGGATGTDRLDFDARFAESGTLNVETRIEQTDDGATTPQSPDFVGSTTTTVAAPGDLTASVDKATVDLGDAQTDTDGTDDITVSALDANGIGLSDQSDANIDDGDIQAVTITLTGNGTEFALENEGGEDTGVDTFSSYDTTGESLSEASITITNEDTGNGDTTTEDFVIESLEAEQNGTVDIEVTADVVNQDDDLTDTTSVQFTDSDSVADLSPSGELTSGSTTSFSLNVTDGDGTALNNRIIDIRNDGGVQNNDLFNVDTNGDGSNEVTGVDLIRINGQTNQIEFDTDGQTNADDGPTPTFVVNDGNYVVENVEVESPGQSVTVEVTAGGDTKAQFPGQVTTVGQAAFNVESDVDPMVAGFQEQVNLTVTNATSGEVVNGSALTDLLSNDAAGDSITQEGTDVSTAGAELDSTLATDTNGDSTVDAVQVDVTPQSTADINVSIDNGDGTKIGSSTISVVEPDVQTNVTSNTLTERLSTSVEVEVVDPRDGSNLFDGDTNPDIRFESFNGTVDVVKADGSDIGAGAQLDDGESISDDNDNGYLTDVSEANQTVQVLPFREQDADDTFTLEISAQSDFEANTETNSYFGNTNVTIEPPQVSATPSNIGIGSTSTIEVTAEDANGDALADRRIDLVGAGVSITNANTDSSGFVAVNVNPQATGSIGIFTASDSGLIASDDIGGETDDDAPGNIANNDALTQEDVVNVTTEQSEFDVTVDPQTVTANTTTTVTVTATNNASGDAVEGASVDLSGAGINESAQTDANGEAAIDVTASETGTIEVTVNDAGFNSATETITVEEAGTESASVTFNDQSVQNGTEEVTVDSANFTRADGSAGDYVVVVHVVNATEFDGGLDSSISAPVGASGNLSNGAESITVDLNSSAAFEDGDELDTLSENVTLRAMLHTTANDSAFGTRLGNAIDGIEPGDETDDANITVTEDAQPQNPVIVGDSPATNIDDDALLEDVNGDGESDFDDAIDLAFNVDAASENVDAFDFDGDGDVDFDDAIALAFE